MQTKCTPALSLSPMLLPSVGDPVHHYEFSLYVAKKCQISKSAISDVCITENSLWSVNARPVKWGWGIDPIDFWPINVFCHLDLIHVPGG